MEQLCEGQMEVCINGPGHMTKMAATPVYGNSITQSPMMLKPTCSMQHRGLQISKVCKGDDPGLSLTYFMARSNLASYVFEREKLLQSHLMVKNLQQMTKLIEDLCL